MLGKFRDEIEDFWVKISKIVDILEDISIFFKLIFDIFVENLSNKFEGFNDGFDNVKV